MGAVESSSLESINKLSLALDEIEKKLVKIEDIHLHHQTQICHDNMLIISGKKIICKEGYHLIIGPILGLITENSVKILVETLTSTIISFHVFLVDNIVEEGQYLFSEILQTESSQPCTITIKNLSPNSHYAIYLGGIDAKDTITSYCYFSTLPTLARDQKFLFTYDTQLVSTSLESYLDNNIWNQISTHTHQRPQTSYSSETFSYNTIEDQKSNSNPVHLMFHMGNMVCIDTILSEHILLLIAEVMNQTERSGNNWKERLINIELEIRNMYRKAFTSSDRVRKCFRSTGHIILCGESECGGVILKDLFSVSKSKTFDEEEDNHQNNQNLIEKTNNEIKEEMKRIKELNKLNGNDEDEDEDEEEIDEFQDLTIETKVYSKISDRIREELYQETEKRYQVKEEEKELLNCIQGLVIRAARRAQIAYCRQLWDDNYTAFQQLDKTEEIAHQDFLTLLKLIHSKKGLRDRLQSSYILLKERYDNGPKHQALVKLQHEVNTLTQEITSLQSNIISFHENSSTRAELYRSSHLQPAIHLFLSIDTKIIIIDSLWCEGLTKTGEPVHGPIRTRDIEVNLSDEFWSTLENDLREIKPLDVNDNLNSLPTCSNILLISSTLLTPSILSSTLPSSSIPSLLEFDYLPSSVLYHNSHFITHKQKLFSLISTWKEQEQKRGCILLSPLSQTYLIETPHLSFFSEGYTQHISKYHEISESNQEEIKDNKIESSLRFIILSSTKKRGSFSLPIHSLLSSSITTSPILSSNYINSLTPPSLLESSLSLWKEYGHIASITPLSSHIYPGYLTLSISNSNSYIRNINHGIEEYNYDVQFHSSLNNPNQTSSLIYLTLGPIIGSITSHSVQILCEFSFNFSSSLSISLYLLDCHTLQQHITHQQVFSGVSTMFTFHSLNPNTLYLIYLDPTISIINSNNNNNNNSSTNEISSTKKLTSKQSIISYIGYFTTSYINLSNSLQSYGLVNYENKRVNIKQKILSVQQQISSHLNQNQNNDQILFPKLLRQYFIGEYTGKLLFQTLQQTSKKIASLYLNENSEKVEHSENNQIVKTNHNQEISQSNPTVTISQSKPVRRMSSLGVTGGISSRQGVNNNNNNNNDNNNNINNNNQNSTHQQLLRYYVSQLIQIENEEISYYFDTLPRVLVISDSSQTFQMKKLDERSKLSMMNINSLINENGISEQVLELSTYPYSGIELFIHIGNAIDLSLGIQNIIEVIKEIEMYEIGSKEEKKSILLETNSFTSSIPIKYKDILQSKYKYAEKLLRNIYKNKWKNCESFKTQIYRYGSHFCCYDDPLTIILNSLNYTSIEYMRQDYSEFCIDLLLSLLEKISLDYHTSLYQSNISNTLTLTSPSLQFIDNQTTCVFHLHPILQRDIYGFREYSSTQSMTISSIQLQQLTSLLLSSSSLSSSSSTTSQNNNQLRNNKIWTLLIITPIPLIPINSSSTPLSYSNETSSNLLELFSNWISEELTSNKTGYVRKVTIISPGLEGLTTKIHCYNTHQMIQKTNTSSTSLNHLNSQTSIDIHNEPILPSHILHSYHSNITISQLFIGYHPSYKKNLQQSQQNPYLLSPKGFLYILETQQTSNQFNCGLINLTINENYRQKLLSNSSLADHLLIDKMTLHLNDPIPKRSDSTDLTISSLWGKMEDNTHHLIFTHESGFILNKESLSKYLKYINREKSTEKRIPSTIQIIWNTIQYILYVQQNQHKLPYPSLDDPNYDHIYHLSHSSYPLTPTLLSIYSTLDLICRRCDGLYQYNFQQYTDIYLPTYISSTPLSLPSHFISSSFYLPFPLLTLLSSIYSSIINLLPNKYRPLFPPPHPLLFSFIWHYFVNHLLPQTEYFIVSDDQNGAVTSHEILIHLLPENNLFFYQLCRLIMMCHGLYIIIREENKLTEVIGIEKSII